MAVFKCKMCGGTLEINNKESVAICEYCGTKQTLPKLDDERKAALYDRANHFRRNNEFDKAAGIYEQILSEDNTDAESYWSLVLCRYGIEYVEDPKTRKRVPTVNRAQYSSIFVDEDYKSALHYADGYQSEIYEQEAVAIDEIQKGILEISQKEDPFDVFICYKETDNNGRRTPDSVYAQDIYKALTEEGYKVFFSRITLEDKLGSAYEPYIFAALNSAKVMLVVGTKAEHFNAVWVKNEWNRYLSLIKSGKKKTLIPIYQEISPYDLPEELSYIQAQDMSKIGFMQDLIHGIKKLIPLKTSAAPNGNVENQMVDSMLKKAFNFISSGDFKSATLCLDTVHAYDADNAMYYVGHLMMEKQCSEIGELAEIRTSIVGLESYKNAINNADDELKETLISYGKHTTYNEALTISDEKTLISDFKRGLTLLDEIDVEELLIRDPEFAKKVNGLKEKLEKQISDRKASIKRAKRKSKVAILSSIAAIFIIIIACFVIVEIKYNSAVEMFYSATEEKEYTELATKFASLHGYKSSALYEFFSGALRNNKATWNMPNIKKLEIPDKSDLIDIMFEDGSFFQTHFPNVQEISFEGKIDKIPTTVFANLKNLSKVEIPEGVTQIGEGAFLRCSGLTNITIPEGVTTIGSHAFLGCSNLANLIIPNSVISLGSNALDDTLLYNDDANWEEGVLYLGRHLIKAKTDISGSYVIKDGTLSIADDAFYSCKGLTSITIPEGAVSIGKDAFLGCSILTNITIPEGVTSIGERAFSCCSSLTNVILPSGIKSIEDYTFSGCSRIKSVAIPDSVTSIGVNSFFGCSELKSVNIGKQVASIGNFAFVNCKKLADIYYSGSQTNREKIKIGNNPELNSAIWHYSSNL